MPRLPDVFIRHKPSEIRLRLPRLMLGLVLCGWGIALMVAANLGLGPWDVLHQGLSQLTGVPIGMVNILVGAAVLLAWIPLRQRLGVGTLLNVVVIGVVIDLTLLVLPEDASLGWRIVELAFGPVLFAVGSGFYIGAGLGPGPRDGLMTGIARRGPSVALVRTGIEMTALAGGWLLGGTVGIGTVYFALVIGPLVGFFLQRPVSPRIPTRSHPDGSAAHAVQRQAWARTG